MGADDKISNKGEEAVGKAKERAGDATDDEDLRSEGKADQMSAKGKQAVDEASEKAKEAADKAKEAFGGDR